MKRFALLVGALAISASANAQDAEFKNAGEFRVRYENDMNRTGLENGQGQANTNARFKWNLTARKGEKTQAFLSLIHNTTFGAGRNDATNAAAPAGSIDTGAGASENSLVVSRAWGWWKASDAVAFKVGRMGIEIADGAVFAEDDYFAFPIAHEGLNAAFDTGFAALNLYLVKQAELTAGAGTTSTDPEQNLYILSADIKNMPEAVKVANVHVVQMQKDSLDDATAGQGSINAQHLGLTVGGDVGAIMYKGTAAFQFGSADKTTAQDVKQSANMFDLMVGYSMPETMGLKISAGYHMDSGDDNAADDKNETYNTMFYDSHNYAGLMDIVNWGNLSYFNVNASIMPSEDTEVGVGYYMFSKTKDNGTSNFGPGVAAAPTLAAGKKDLGSELDLFVNRSYGTDVKVGARFGMFMPGAAIKEGVTPNADKTMMDVMLQASLGF